MTPRERYGAEFFYQPFTVRKADGSEFQCHDIGVCITPKHDAESTLEYAWEVLRELTRWACEEFKDRPTTETYRIVVAWSKSVREHQGHIVKLRLDLAKVREVAGCATPTNVRRVLALAGRHSQLAEGCICTKGLTIATPPPISLAHTVALTRLMQSA
jgi:hypothetical protein